MDIGTRDEFWEAVTIIEARRTLNSMTVAMSPYMKPEEYEKVHRGYHKQAYPDIYERAVRHLEASDIQKRLAMRG